MSWSRSLVKHAIVGGAIGYGAARLLQLLPVTWRLAADGGLMVAVLWVLLWLKRDLARDRRELQVLRASIEHSVTALNELRVTITEPGETDGAQ